MGTKMAPPYANLFLGYLETSQILNSEYKKHLKIYLRFLDDIFILWTGTENEMQNFFKHLNKIHPTIKFTFMHSNNEIQFLDTTIYINQITKKLNSKLFIKPTDTRTLLHFQSYHPLHTKKSIIYSQAIRYRTIITDNKILNEELKALKIVLKNRGYPNRIINKEIEKIKNLTQNQLLFTQTKKRRHSKYKSYNKHPSNKPRKTKTIPFIIPYSEHLTKLQQIITKHWYIIEKDCLLRNIFPNKPLIAYKKHKNLKNLLITSTFSE